MCNALHIRYHRGVKASRWRHSKIGFRFTMVPRAVLSVGSIKLIGQTVTMGDFVEQIPLHVATL